jgi:hypothetical protein
MVGVWRCDRKQVKATAVQSILDGQTVWKYSVQEITVLEFALKKER